MSETIPLGAIDLAVFVLYMVVAVALGFFVAGRHRKTAKGYFLGDRQLPWYVVGTSMIAADISSDDLIANAGAAYKYGIVPSRRKLERLDHLHAPHLDFPAVLRAQRHLHDAAVPRAALQLRLPLHLRHSLIVGYVAAILGGTLYAGALALESMLEHGSDVGHHFLRRDDRRVHDLWRADLGRVDRFHAGVPAAHGGRPDPRAGPRESAGSTALMQEYPDKFQVFLPPTHERFPFTGVFTGFLTVGIWYSCTSQHMVQRVLGAKDEWHARMGVVGAGYLRIITPFFFVLPGIIAFKLFPNLPRQDMAYLELVKVLVPTGLRGLILAGMAAALMSNVSSVLNSASTLATMDIYGKAHPPERARKNWSASAGSAGRSS